VRKNVRKKREKEKKDKGNVTKKRKKGNVRKNKNNSRRVIQ
jgi:hypothetical protein